MRTMTTRPAPTRRFTRSRHGVGGVARLRLKRISGITTNGTSSIISARVIIARPTARPSASARFIDGARQYRYAIHTDSVVVKIDMVSLVRNPSCDQTLG